MLDLQSFSERFRQSVVTETAEGVLERKRIASLCRAPLAVQAMSSNLHEVMRLQVGSSVLEVSHSFAPLDRSSHEEFINDGLYELLVTNGSPLKVREASGNAFTHR